MKYYEFAFKSKSYENFDGFGNKLINFLIPFFIFGIISMILYETPISDFWWFSIAIKVAFVICFIFAILLTCMYKNKPKGVFLYNDYIDIYRQSVSRGHTFKMNFRINISDIKSCEIKKVDDSNNGVLLYHMIGGTGDYFVMIRTNNDRVFCFCLENQNEFVEQLKEKIEKY